MSLFNCLVYLALYLSNSSACAQEVLLCLKLLFYNEGPKAVIVLIPVIDDISSDGLNVFFDGSLVREGCLKPKA